MDSFDWTLSATPFLCDGVGNRLKLHSQHVEKLSPMAEAISKLALTSITVLCYRKVSLRLSSGDSQLQNPRQFAGKDVSMSR